MLYWDAVLYFAVLLQAAVALLGVAAVLLEAVVALLGPVGALLLVLALFLLVVVAPVVAADGLTVVAALLSFECRVGGLQRYGLAFHQETDAVESFVVDEHHDGSASVVTGEVFHEVVVMSAGFLGLLGR